MEDQSKHILITNIIFDEDYDFVIKYKDNEFIEITLNRSYIVYQQLITKSDIQLNKLYELIINGLNKELNYLIDIKLDNDIQFNISFNNDIRQQIILIRQSNTKSTEILLLDKVKELDKKISLYINKKIRINDNYFDINTKNLDLSNIGFNSKYELDNTLDRFINIKTLIIHGGLVEYLLTPIKELDDYRNKIDTIIIIGSGYVDIQLVLNYCCTLINKQSIIIKNAKIIYHIKGETFYFRQNYTNDKETHHSYGFVKNIKLYDMLSNLERAYFKIIFENVLYDKHTYCRINGEEFRPHGVFPSNFQEFITISELNKYNIFQNI